MRRTLVAACTALALLVLPASGALAQEAPPTSDPPVPASSGEGRRIVYSNGQQRVWLVEAEGTVAKTHLVSGRRGYPRAGTYAVFSRSEVSRAGSLTLRHMVRFTSSRRLAVGFHEIPVNRRGRPIQSIEQLGTPRSRGCVRQAPADAKYVWDWAPIGTPVVVVP